MLPLGAEPFAKAIRFRQECSRRVEQEHSAVAPSTSELTAHPGLSA